MKTTVPPPMRKTAIPPTRKTALLPMRKAPELLQQLLQTYSKRANLFIPPGKVVQPAVTFDQTYYKPRPSWGPPAATPESAIRATSQAYRQKRPRTFELSQAPDEYADAYFGVMIIEEESMSKPNNDHFSPQNSAGPSKRLKMGTIGAIATPADRMVVNKKQADSNGYDSFQGIQQGPNNDHTYYINPFAQDEPPHHIHHHGTQPSTPDKAVYCNCCKMLSTKVKLLKGKLAVLLAQQGKKETSQTCFQMEPIAETMQDKLNKQLMSKYEQALKEIHKWKDMYKTLQKIKSEPDTTQTKEADVNSKSKVDEVYCQLEACCTERDQYKSEVEQLKQQKLQMDSEMSKFRFEVEKLKEEMQNTASPGTSSDKRHNCPCSLELSPAPVKNGHVILSESGILPNGNNNGFNITIHEEQSNARSNTGNSKTQSAGPEMLNEESIPAATALIDKVVMQDSGGVANFHASQPVPKTNDYYYNNSTATEKELLHQSSVPALDFDKDYYHKHFKVLSAKVKQLESRLAVTLIQQKKTSLTCIQTNPMPEPMQDRSRMQLVSQYEEAMKEIQMLEHKYNTMKKPQSKPESTPAKEAEVQSKSEVNKRPVRVDRVLRQLDGCCTERDLYKSEVELLKQQKSQLDSENSQLRTELVELGKVTQIPSSTDTSRDKSAKLRNLRVNVSHLLTMLVPNLNFQRLSCEVDAVDGILHQVLKETET